MVPPRPRRAARASLATFTSLAASLAAVLAGAGLGAVPAQAAPGAAVGSGSQSTTTPVSTRGMQEPGVTVNLWEWNWRSIAAECPRLDRAGYEGVQVAPPQDSVKRTQTEASDPGTGSAILHPWWEVYQAVDYGLTSRMGDEAEFKAMVSTCRKAGVKVYVDTVINHTTGQGTQSYGGKTYSSYDYPDAGYDRNDFHVPRGECPTDNGGISDYNSKTQVFNCNLSGLQDLATQTPKVRGTLADYLNKLLGYGVSGFRVDAGKHVGQQDLNAIYSKLRRTKDGKRPYWALEVFGGSPGALAPQAFEVSGDVLGLDGARQIFNAFKSYGGSGNLGDISGLSTFGSASGLTKSSKTLSFVTNHDTDRNPGEYLGYRDGDRYLLATEWLLADGYGSPQVYSSFAIKAPTGLPDSASGDDRSGKNASPPAAADGMITDADCSSEEWTCDHRLNQVVSMVRFHRYVAGRAKRNVYDREYNVLAFSRGSRGWAGFNNNDTTDFAGASGERTITVQTGLRAGRYCDIVSGGKAARGCTGTEVRVRSNGRARVTLPARGAVAFTAKDRIS